MPTLDELRASLRGGLNPDNPVTPQVKIPKDHVCAACDGGYVGLYGWDSKSMMPKSLGVVKCPNCTYNGDLREWPGLERAALGGKCYVARTQDEVQAMAHLARTATDTLLWAPDPDYNSNGAWAKFVRGAVDLESTRKPSWMLLCGHLMPRAQVHEDAILHVTASGLYIWRPCEKIHIQVDEIVPRVPMIPGTAEVDQRELGKILFNWPLAQRIWESSTNTVWWTEGVGSDWTMG